MAALVAHHHVYREAGDTGDRKIGWEEIASDEEKLFGMTKLDLKVAFAEICYELRPEKCWYPLSGCLRLSCDDRLQNVCSRHWTESVIPAYPSPPTYEEALLDPPPDFTTSEELARAHSAAEIGNGLDMSQALMDRSESDSQSITNSSLLGFDDESGFRQHGGKKNKKSKKGADWDSDNENKPKEEGTAEGGDNAGGGGDAGGGGGAGAGGGGGDEGNGGGDDDWAEWSGAKGKKKKGKKGKAEEEEELKKKQEEEEAAAAAAAQKTEENPLSWADDTGDKADDDWGIAGTKKKKEKKKKAETAEPTTTSAGGFDDINLLDDNAGVPKIDMSFGESDKKDSGSGFGFGGWSGGAWGGAAKTATKTTSWSFGDADKETKNTAAGAAEESTDIGWSFGANGTKKKDKTNIASGFDFDLNDSKTTSAEVDKKKDEEDDGFGSTWGTFGKKEKKSKKSSLVEEIGAVAVTTANDEAENTWSAWDAGKKKKKDDILAKETSPPPAVPEEDEWSGIGKKSSKAKKKGITEDVEPISAASTKPAEDTWGGWDAVGKKDKKKTKVVEEVKEPEPDPVPEKQEEDDIWSSFAKKGGKKDKKKTTDIGKESTTAAETTAPASDIWSSMMDKKPKAEPASNDATKDWLGGTAWGSTTKEKKSKKNDPEPEPETIKVVEDDTWPTDVWGGKKKAPAKTKETKSLLADNKDEDISLPPAAPEPPADDIWGLAKSKKDKTTGKKSKFTSLEPEPEPKIEPEPEPEQPQEEEEEDWSHLTPKERRKKEKEKKKREEEEKKRKEEEEMAREAEEAEARRQEEEEAAAKQKAEEEAAAAAKKEAEDKKKRLEDKKLTRKPTATTKKTTKAVEEVPPPPPPEPPVVEEDIWNVSSWNTPATKKKGKKGKDEPEPEVIPRAPSPPNMGLTPEPDEEPDDWFSTKKKGTKTTTSASKDKSLLDDFGVIDEPKKKAETKEKETTKVAKSTWGWGAAAAVTTATATKASKLGKDKEAAKESKIEENKVDDLLDLDDEPVFKSKTKGTTSKLSKTTSKANTEAPVDKQDDLDELLGLDDPSPDAETTAKDKKQPAAAAKSDAWSFWGSAAKKTPVKKEKEGKEIGSAKSTNQELPSRTAEISEKNNKKMPEESAYFDDAPVPQDSRDLKSASKMKSAATTSTKQSVADRVKSLEKSKLSKKAEAERAKQEAEDQPPPPPEPPAEPVSSKAKATATATSKAKSSTAATASATKSTKSKDIVSASSSDKKATKESVPGSFPDDIVDTDLMDIIDTPTKSLPKSKTATAKTKTSKTKKEEKIDLGDDLLGDAPIVDAPPTPPPEPKAKKERARIVKDENASSWGLWGAAPKKAATVKKSTKAKDDADIVSPSREKPSIARSKSTRTAKEKEKEESRSSGGSEKEKKAEARPRTSRQSTFGGLFGAAAAAPPPATRPKTTTRSSTNGKSSSRRQSVADVGRSGMPSPPPEDELNDLPEMTDKAAKLMGVGSKDKRKKRSGIPDPYAIDDDDMVIVNPIEDPIINAPIPKKEKRGKVSRTTSKQEPKVVSDTEDIVMVNGASPPGPDDDKAFDRPALQRSNTSGKKSSGFMGLFGKRKGEADTTRAVSGDEAYGGSRRKRTAGDVEEGSKRPRRSRRSEKRDEAEGQTTDAPTGNNTEAEDAEARREARRARKEEKERQARKAELRELEERRARRELKSKSATEARKSRIREAREKNSTAEVVDDILSPDGEGDETETPRKHRTDDERRTRHKSSRRSSHIDGPLPTRTAAEEESRRARSSKSKSKRTSALMTDYFDTRNGKATPYSQNAAKGSEKTHSWINSQVLDPPAAPPVVETILEPEPVLGEASKDFDESPPLDEDEERRRRRRTERRKSRSERVLGDEETSRRRRADTADPMQRSSEGSEERELERDRRRRAGSTGYGRPTMDKRTSWFKKLGI